MAALLTLMKLLTLRTVEALLPSISCVQSAINPFALTGLVATQLRTLSIFSATPTAPKVMLLASVLVPAAAPLRLA